MVYALGDEGLTHIFRSGIDQPRPVRVARGLDGAGGQPPVKRFAACFGKLAIKSAASPSVRSSVAGP
jgi:hypothetical protein